MRGLVAVLSAALSLLVLASADVGQGQTPFNVFGDLTNGGNGRWPPPYDLFVQHNSLQRSGTEIYLHDEMKKHFPGKAITVTADRQFAPLRFAAGANERIQMRESKDVESLKQVFFQKPARRREGHGRVADVVTFGGYDIAWKDYDMKAIVATWRDGYSLVTQWHIISDDGKAAHEFIQECSEWCTTFRDAVLVFDNGYWSPDFSLYQEVQKADWKDVILDEEFKHKLQHDYRSFLKSEKIYKNLSVPWKRGLIFLGPPGNGKTISLKAIMKDVELPLLYVKSFRTYMGDEMGIRQIFQRARAEAPCVLIMEDLDSLINNQNRAFFLNELDGLEDNDGLLLIGTTNHFDRLDPALSNRPSRFDRKYNFPNPSKDERKQYALYWKAKLSDTKDIDWPAGLEDEVADRTDKFSFAYLKEAFVSALLTIAGREPGTEPPNFRDTLFDQIQALREGLENAPEVLALPPAPQLGRGGFRAEDCCGDFDGMDGDPFEGEAVMAQREGMRFGGDMYNLVDVL